MLDTILQDMKLLSIVIPCYKAENFLPKCIDSALSALVGCEERYEIILVNDGSPDTTPQICDEYAEKHKHIKVIHQENQGPSIARNNGIKMAGGKFLAFFDADDYVEGDMRPVLDILEKDDDTDIFNVGMKYMSGDGKVKRMHNRKNKTYKKGEKSFYNFATRIFSSCTQIIRREFITSNDLYLASEYRFGEDFEWTMRMRIKATKVRDIPVNYYRYCFEQQGSLTKADELAHLQKYVGVARTVLERIENSALSENDKKKLKSTVHVGFYVRVLKAARYKKANMDDVYTEIKKNKDLLKYPKGFSCKTFKIFLTIFGLKLSLKLLRIL